MRLLINLRSKYQVGFIFYGVLAVIPFFQLKLILLLPLCMHIKLIAIVSAA